MKIKNIKIHQILMIIIKINLMKIENIKIPQILMILIKINLFLIHSKIRQKKTNKKKNTKMLLQEIIIMKIHNIKLIPLKIKIRIRMKSL